MKFAVILHPWQRRAGHTRNVLAGPAHHALEDFSKRDPGAFFSIRRRPTKVAPSDVLLPPAHIGEFLDIPARNRVSGAAEKLRSDAANIRSAAIASDIIEAARRAAYALVDREHRRTLSRMRAYENVANMIGASEGWVRKFVGRSPDVKPDLVIGFNILMQYARVTAPPVGSNEQIDSGVSNSL